MRDGPHPLSLLSDVGARLRAMGPDDVSQPRDVSDAATLHPAAAPYDMVVYPGWTRTQLEHAARQKRVYYQYGLSAIKRDIAPSLDPISRGLVDEATAGQLVDGFFKWCQPQVGIMDPALHTVSYLRSTSASLLTAVLAAAVQTRQQPGDAVLARKLYGHSERLFATAVSTNAKSPELALALLVLYLWPLFPSRNLDDRSRIFLTLAINMAIELGLPRLPLECSGNEGIRRRHRDRVRTWAALYVHDRSLSAFSGRPPLIKEHRSTDDMRSWLQDPLATPGDQMITAYLELRAIENEARTRLGQTRHSYMAEAIRSSAVLQLDAWIEEWCEQLTETHPDFANVMHFVSTHLALLILSKGPAWKHPRAHQGEMSRRAEQSLQFLLAKLGHLARYICRTVCAMISWEAVIYLRLVGESGRELVRAVAVALAPFGDGRMDTGAGHFYGSFLLELSFDSGFKTVDRQLATELDESFLPSPSTLWVLQQSGIGGERPCDSATLLLSGAHPSAPLSSSPGLLHAYGASATQTMGMPPELYESLASSLVPDQLGQPLQSSSADIRGRAPPGGPSHLPGAVSGRPSLFGDVQDASTFASLETVLNGGDQDGAGFLETPAIEVDWPWLFDQFQAP